MYSEGWQTTDSTRCSSLLNTGQCPEIVVVWLDRTVVEYHHLEYRITSLEIAKRVGWGRDYLVWFTLYVKLCLYRYVYLVYTPVRTWVVHWYLIIVPRHHLNRVQVGGNMDIKMAIIIQLPSIEHRSCIEGVVS